MSGTILNVLTIIAGTVIGLSVGRFIHDRFHDIAFWAIGLSTLGFGISMVVKGFSAMGESSMGDYSTLVIVASMVLGSLLGEALNIERWLRRFGEWIQRRVHKIPLFHDKDTENPRTIVDGFMTASILYCVGPMTILGSIQDGIGQHATLYLKSALDGVSAILLASTLGAGVGFSSIPILIFEGTLALGASVFGKVFTESVISSITAVGGLLIIAIAFDILKIKKFRVANMLPALVLAAVLGGIIG